MVNTKRVVRDVVVVGASAGGVEALRQLFSAIPAGFPGVIAVVQHRHPLHAGKLPEVLGRGARVRIREPHARVPVEPGNVYLAPRDRHMTFADGSIRLERGPKVHATRPAADPLFLSAAQAYGERVVGVVLTGGGDDGVDGLIGIKAAGGVSIAQDPDEATYPFMPRNAIVYDEVDLVLPVREIAEALVALAEGKTVVERAA